MDLDQDIQRRVIALLTATSSENQEGLQAVLEGLLSDFISVEYPLPEGHEAQTAARAAVQAVTDGMKDPLTDLLVTFCAAFGELARVNDAGVTEMKSGEVLRKIALAWEQPD